MIPRRSIRPRKPELPFSSTIPRHWFGGSAVATHIANGVNLLFPAGERFFVRSVKHYFERFRDDPEARAAIRGFFGQEGRHAREHERFFQVLEAQGYEIRGFLAMYERVTFGVLEPLMPPALRLAVTAAAEHFTAIMANRALEYDFLDTAHPVMRKLMLWHAAEEIEHKAVAFDVLQRVSPSYTLRAAGLFVAAVVLAAWWLGATRMLLSQDGIEPSRARRDLRKLREYRATKTGRPTDSIGRYVFLHGIRSYLRRDFHPNDHDNYHLARAFLEQLAASPDPRDG